MHACSCCGKTAADVEKLIAGPDVNICNSCVAELMAELRELPSDPELSAAQASDERCSFCSKARIEVKRLFRRRDRRICDECVTLCSDIVMYALATKEVTRLGTAGILNETRSNCSYTRLVIPVEMRDHFENTWRELLSAVIVKAGAESITFMFGGASKTKLSWFVLVAWKDDKTSGEDRLQHKGLPQFLDQMCAVGILKSRPVWYSVSAITLKP
jgi:hypothetical protein